MAIHSVGKQHVNPSRVEYTSNNSLELHVANNPRAVLPTDTKINGDSISLAHDLLFNPDLLEAILVCPPGVYSKTLRSTTSPTIEGSNEGNNVKCCCPQVQIREEIKLPMKEREPRALNASGSSIATHIQSRLFFHRHFPPSHSVRSPTMSGAEVANGGVDKLTLGERRLEGKVAIVTGGAAGIGEAIARLFTKHGAKVIIADIADKAGKKLEEELGGCATYVHCDVSKEEDVSAAVDVAVKLHGCLDIMYNNAATNDTAMAKNVGEYEMEQFDRVMRVNVKGVMLGIKHAARVMIPRKKGCILCTSSVGGLLGGFSPYSYTASKHAIIGLTKNAAAELGKYGIRVNAVSPYGVATALALQYFKNGDSSAISQEDTANMENFLSGIGNLKGPILKAQDIAEAGLYLASDEAKYALHASGSSIATHHIQSRLFFHRHFPLSHSVRSPTMSGAEVANGGVDKLTLGERRLEGKVAIVTRGAAGIGEAIARLFTKHGAKVIIADIADKAGKKLEEELGGCATYVHCDVSKEEDVSAAVDVAVKLHGCLDIMYNNAATNDTAMARNVGEYEMEQFDRVMRVNVKGVMLGIKHAARVMIPRNKGCILCTTSVAALLGGLAPYSYTASKHAIIGLTKNAAAELGKYGIRVNAVSPYGVATALALQYFKNGDSSTISQEDTANMENFLSGIGNLKGPILKAQDIAEAGLYLASDDAKYNRDGPTIIQTLLNGISPYGVATALSLQYLKNGDSFAISQEDTASMENFLSGIGNLKGPILKAQDIAEAGLYLASDEAKYVSGHNLVVDGGFTVVNHSWGLYR
eukprot:Gb_32339 [translate_table: standard]